MEINGHRFGVYRQKANLQEIFVEFIGDKNKYREPQQHLFGVPHMNLAL